MSKDCMKALLAHTWPGNVRELQNVIERAVILCSEGGVLEPAHLGPLRADLLTGADNGTSGVFGPDGELLSLVEVEKRQILAAIKRCQNNRTHAAKALHISIRTLRNKLREYNLEDAEDTSAEGEEAVVA
jgi:DNA-binding NtrC family response regulator